jgi:hypothetical protein
MQGHARRCERRLTAAASELLRFDLAPQPCAAVRKTAQNEPAGAARREQSGLRFHCCIQVFHATAREIWSTRTSLCERIRHRDPSGVPDVVLHEQYAHPDLTCPKRMAAPVNGAYHADAAYG